MTRCQRCGRQVTEEDSRSFTAIVTLQTITLCRRCARGVGAMSPYEANLMAREVVQQVANLQPGLLDGIIDEHDDMTITGAQLEEIVFVVIKDWLWEGEPDETRRPDPATDPGGSGG